MWGRGRLGGAGGSRCSRGSGRSPGTPAATCPRPEPLPSARGKVRSGARDEGLPDVLDPRERYRHEEVRIEILCHVLSGDGAHVVHVLACPLSALISQAQFFSHQKLAHHSARHRIRQRSSVLFPRGRPTRVLMKVL